MRAVAIAAHVACVLAASVGDARGAPRPDLVVIWTPGLDRAPIVAVASGSACTSSTLAPSHVLAAMGALIGDPDGELEVLRRITPESVIAGKQLLADGRVTIGITDVPNILYAEVRLTKGPDKVRVCIADSHTQVVRIEKNGEVLLATESQANSHSPLYNLHGSSLHDVFTFAISARSSAR